MHSSYLSQSWFQHLCVITKRQACVTLLLPLLWFSACMGTPLSLLCDLVLLMCDVKDLSAVFPLHVVAFTLTLEHGRASVRDLGWALRGGELMIPLHCWCNGMACKGQQEADRWTESDEHSQQQRSVMRRLKQRVPTTPRVRMTRHLTNNNSLPPPWHLGVLNAARKPPQ